MLKNNTDKCSVPALKSITHCVVLVPSYYLLCEPQSTVIPGTAQGFLSENYLCAMLQLQYVGSSLIVEYKKLITTFGGLLGEGKGRARLRASCSWCSRLGRFLRYLTFSANFILYVDALKER